MKDQKQLFGILLIVLFSVLVLIIISNYPAYSKRGAENAGLSFDITAAYGRAVSYCLLLLPLLLIGIHFLLNNDHPVWKWQINRKRSGIVAYIFYFLAISGLSMSFDRIGYPIEAMLLFFSLAIIFYIGKKKKLSVSINKLPEDALPDEQSTSIQIPTAAELPNWVCQKCKSKFSAKPIKRNFLAFKTAKCPKCNNVVLYPFNASTRVFMQISFIVTSFMAAPGFFILRSAHEDFKARSGKALPDLTYIDYFLSYYGWFWTVVAVLFGIAIYKNYNIDKNLKQENSYG